MSIILIFLNFKLCFNLQNTRFKTILRNLSKKIFDRKLKKIADLFYKYNFINQIYLIRFSDKILIMLTPHQKCLKIIKLITLT